ncbi:MAG: hypothetical protein WCD70_08030 [Alphaproteobacteria bacterium]
MKTITSILFAITLMLGAITAPDLSRAADQPPSTELALLCFAKGEQISGLNKICFYDCAGSGTAITVKSYELCPLTING